MRGKTLIECTGTFQLLLGIDWKMELKLFARTTEDNNCKAFVTPGYGMERAKGSAMSRHYAFLLACAAIDEIEENPYRFPVNLVGYPEQLEGDVVTADGEILGRWRSSGDEALELVDFMPAGTDVSTQ